MGFLDLNLSLSSKHFKRKPPGVFYSLESVPDKYKRV